MKRCGECGPCQEYILAPANAGRCTRHGRPTPLTNAERQARRRKFSDRPIMGVTISRFVQAAVAEQAESRGVTMSENVEEALESFAGEARRQTLTLTDKGADILGQCTACKLYFLTGDRVRRDGEFARHEGCRVT